MKDFFKRPQKPPKDYLPYEQDPSYGEQDPSYGEQGPSYGQAPGAVPGGPGDGNLEDFADEDELEAGEGRGCSWFLIMGLALVLCVIGGVIWGVREIATRNMAKPLAQSFSDISLLPAPRIEPEKGDMQIQIYYIIRGQALTADSRQIRKPATGIERMHLIAQQFTTPPKNGLLQSPLPEGTTIRGLYLVDGFVWLDLSAEFLNVKNPTPLQERLTIYALVNSFLLNDPTLKGVRIMIDGKPVSTAWGWLDLSSPLGPDLSLIH
jgi:hypothetical protein